ncbi:MAG: LPS export ABC transporter permease LptF [Burkholderiaceae bacterium]|jgi:lipopolysaccharide export system permease protein|nr:LPS export ABC transporter permease LptF [Burkholderiaceae bacterium]
MLFHLAFRKELGRNFGATLLVLLTIVMTTMLIKALGQASSGRVNPSEVLLVMGYTVMGQLPTILTLSLFVAVTATLTRMYAASEMVVWFSCGQSLASFLRPLLRFALPILAVIALLALLAWPWSNQQIQGLRERYQGRNDIDRVAPGQFQESRGGTRVFFIDKDSPGSQSASNIFIATAEKGKQSITTAQSGRTETLGAQRFVVLSQGQRLDIDDTTGATRLMEFAEYGAQIGERELAAPRPQERPRYKSTLQLLREPTPRNLSELSWRIGLVLAALNCGILALAATRINPRVGQSAGLVFALLAFACYYNMINVGQSWIASGKVNIALWLLQLHGGILALSLLWLALRQGGCAIWGGRKSARGDDDGAAPQAARAQCAKAAP